MDKTCNVVNVRMAALESHLIYCENFLFYSLMLFVSSMITITTPSFCASDSAGFPLTLCTMQIYLLILMPVVCIDLGRRESQE